MGSKSGQGFSPVVRGTLGSSAAISDRELLCDRLLRFRGAVSSFSVTRERLAFGLLSIAAGFESSSGSVLLARFRPGLPRGWGSRKGFVALFVSLFEGKDWLRDSAGSSTRLLSGRAATSFDNRRDRRNVRPSGFFVASSGASLDSLLETSPFTDEIR